MGYIEGMDSCTWVGHATVLLDVGGARLVTDPLLRGRVAHLRRQTPVPSAPRDLDAVLISHLHMDHLDPPSLRMLDSRVPVLAPRGAGEFLRSKGCIEVIELAPGESRDVRGVTVRATPATHDERRRPLGGPVAEPIGFDISWDGRRAYFAGDTAEFAGMSDVAHGLDLALLPIAGWGPSMGPGHLDAHEAAAVAAMLAPRVVVPIHWGTYFPAGLAWRHPEALRDPPERFAAQVAALAPGVEVRAIEPGASFDL